MNCFVMRKKAANKILNQPLDQGPSSAFILKHAKIINACHNIPEAKTTKKICCP